MANNVRHLFTHLFTGHVYNLSGDIDIYFDCYKVLFTSFLIRSGSQGESKYSLQINHELLHLSVNCMQDDVLGIRG